LVLIAAHSFAYGQKVGTPAHTVDQFYNKYLQLNIGGLPDAEQSKAINPFLSKEIKDLIAADIEKQKQFIKDDPDEKPPWIEGDLFSSLFEGATEYKIGKTTQQGNTAKVDVALSRKDSSGESNWTDTVVLAKSGKMWVITDIIFNGQWQFKTGSSLLNVLR
jgi:hypothetical protein